MPTQFQTALGSRSVARGYGRELVPGFVTLFLKPVSFVRWTNTSTQRLGGISCFFLMGIQLHINTYQSLPSHIEKEQTYLSLRYFIEISFFHPLDWSFTFPYPQSAYTTLFSYIYLHSISSRVHAHHFTHPTFTYT